MSSTPPEIINIVTGPIRPIHQVRKRVTNDAFVGSKLNFDSDLHVFVAEYNELMNK